MTRAADSRVGSGLDGPAYGTADNALNPEVEVVTLDQGWDMDPLTPPGIGRRVCIEVYPHSAMVSLFPLDYVIPYKLKPGRDLPALKKALRADAARFTRRYPEWDRTGVSGYLARDDNEVGALCQTRMVNFETVVVFTRRDLERNGIHVVGTFRTPHVTLAANDIQTLLAALIGCPHEVRDNPYHGDTNVKGGQMNATAVDLPVDLNSEDDTGLPWGFLDESQNPSKITEGAWIIAGSSRTQAVAQVVDICDGIVHVRPLPGSVASHRSLLISVA